MNMHPNLGNHKNLSIYIRKIDEFLKDDWHTSEAALNMRKSLEYMTKQYCQKYGIAEPIPDNDESLYTSLRNLEELNCFSKEQLSRIHRIRKFGNKYGAHDNMTEAGLTETKSVFQLLTTMLDDFLEEFPDPYEERRKSNMEGQRQNIEKNYYYKILGVNPDARDEDIKKAYHRVASIYHPDQGVQNDEMFKTIQEAYDTLKNPQKRKEYDWEQEHPARDFTVSNNSHKEQQNRGSGNTYTSDKEYGVDDSRMDALNSLLITRGFIGIVIGTIIGYFFLRNRTPEFLNVAIFGVVGAYFGLFGFKDGFICLLGILVVGIIVVLIIGEGGICGYLLTALLVLIPIITILYEIIGLKKIKNFKAKKNIELASSVIVIAFLFAVSVFLIEYTHDGNVKASIQEQQVEIMKMYKSDVTLRNVPENVDLSKNIVDDGYGESVDDIITFNNKESAIVDNTKQQILVPIYMELVRIYKNEEWNEVAESYYITAPYEDDGLYDYYYIQYILQKDPGYVEEYSLDKLVSSTPEIDIIAYKAKYQNGYYLEDGTWLKETVSLTKYEEANDGLIVVKVPKEFHDYAIGIRGDEFVSFFPNVGWNCNELLK